MSRPNIEGIRRYVESFDDVDVAVLNKMRTLCDYIDEVEHVLRAMGCGACSLQHEVMYPDCPRSFAGTCRTRAILHAADAERRVGRNREQEEEE